MTVAASAWLAGCAGAPKSEEIVPECTTNACEGNVHVACFNGQPQRTTCDQGTMCSLTAASLCVCNNASDGMCPEGCSNDPDCANCTPSCSGKACGASDGCGGVCEQGTCDNDKTCDDGVCVATQDPCSAHATCDACDADSACGWCGAQNACVSKARSCSAWVDTCPTTCTPQCDARECGSNGCGGECGTGCGSSTCVDGVVDGMEVTATSCRPADQVTINFGPPCPSSTNVSERCTVGGAEPVTVSYTSAASSTYVSPVVSSEPEIFCDWRADGVLTITIAAPGTDELTRFAADLGTWDGMDRELARVQNAWLWLYSGGGLDGTAFTYRRATALSTDGCAGEISLKNSGDTGNWGIDFSLGCRMRRGAGSTDADIRHVTMNGSCNGLLVSSF